MRICLTAPEFFVAGNYGGFGAVVRKLAHELSRRGILTWVFVPRNGALEAIEQRDGYIVVSYPGGAYTGLEHARRFSTVPELIDADVFHSQEPSIATRIAQIGCPKRRHVVTLQAPATAADWEKLWVGRGIPEDSKRRFLQAYRNEVGASVASADRVFVQSEHIVGKGMKLYELTEPPEVMPNPVDVPEREPVKSRTPLVCLLGRWDPIKRPELFMQLAQRFPKVDFVALGGCNSDGIERERNLRRTYAMLTNLSLPGWVFGREKSAWLERSWILVNTSAHECLPVSFLEACAHRCAILSFVDANRFASRFGRHVREDNVESLAEGLEYLLEHDRWKALGEQGYEHVRRHHETELVVSRLIEVYQSLSRRAQ